MSTKFFQSILPSSEKEKYSSEKMKEKEMKKNRKEQEELVNDPVTQIAFDNFKIINWSAVNGGKNVKISLNEEAVKLYFNNKKTGLDYEIVFDDGKEKKKFLHDFDANKKEYMAKKKKQQEERQERHRRASLRSNFSQRTATTNLSQYQAVSVSAQNQQSGGDGPDLNNNPEYLNTIIETGELVDNNNSLPAQQHSFHGHTGVTGQQNFRGNATSVRDVRLQNITQHVSPNIKQQQQQHQRRFSESYNIQKAGPGYSVTQQMSQMAPVFDQSTHMRIKNAPYSTKVQIAQNQNQNETNYLSPNIQNITNSPSSNISINGIPPMINISHQSNPASISQSGSINTSMYRTPDFSIATEDNSQFQNNQNNINNLMLRQKIIHKNQKSMHLYDRNTFSRTPRSQMVANNTGANNTAGSTALGSQQKIPIHPGGSISQKIVNLGSMTDESFDAKMNLRSNLNYVDSIGNNSMQNSQQNSMLSAMNSMQSLGSDFENANNNNSNNSAMSKFSKYSKMTSEGNNNFMVSPGSNVSDGMGKGSHLILH